MIVAMEFNGLNDTRPFLLTWNFGTGSYDMEIPKNIHRADLEAGWNMTGKNGDNFHITLTPHMVEIDKLEEEDNGEHRFWMCKIIDVSGDTPKTIGSGSVSWGEFYVMDGLHEDDFIQTDKR